MRLDDVAFRYHRRAPWVLRDVTLSLPPGSVTEVTGRNGAGKSTLLRLIAGLRAPGRGSVRERPSRVGYAPERFPVDQPFTVRSYLGHMAAVRRVPDDAIGAWAERLAFDHLLDVRLPDDLREGDRIAIGTAGAYTTAYASRFNGFDVPKTHVLRAAEPARACLALIAAATMGDRT